MYKSSIISNMSESPIFTVGKKKYQWVPKLVMDKRRANEKKSLLREKKTKNWAISKKYKLVGMHLTTEHRCDYCQNPSAWMVTEMKYYGMADNMCEECLETLEDRFSEKIEFENGGCCIQ